VIFDVNSNKLAETDAYYDGSSSVCGSGGAATASVANLSVTSHDQAYGPTAATFRGNVTKVAAYLNNGTGPITSYTYDETGQELSATDPKGYITSYSYTDKFTGGNPSKNTNAYLTTITEPTVNGQKLLKYSYDLPTGFLSSSTDVNNQVTMYAYADTSSLDRLTDIYQPASAQNGGTKPDTHYSYIDGENSSVAVTSPIGGTVTDFLDGMGRTITSEASSPSSTTQTTATQYNGMGQIAGVTNSYFTSADASFGVTSYLYDALGRKTTQCQPDNGNPKPFICAAGSSYQAWTYNGNVTIFRNELGNTWQQTKDAQARLTNVVEPGSLSTTYAYDGLNNLTSVSQAGKSGDSARTARTFTYDSLSRLICSSNSESNLGSCPSTVTATFPTGVTQYSYDLNGNVHSKLAPAVDTASGSGLQITTTYAYDALNRLLSKLSGSPFLSSCYQYDGTGVTNGSGRLAAEWTAAGSCAATVPTTGAFSIRSILSYDETGRATNERQCSIGSCSSTTGPQLAYTYDLAGNSTGLSNSVGASTGSLSLVSGFDGEGHFRSMTSTWPQPNSPTTVYTLGTYGPVGPLQWTLGSKLSLSKTYTDRLRVGSISTSQANP
jgi:YD repeat-containing protein